MPSFAHVRRPCARNQCLSTTGVLKLAENSKIEWTDHTFNPWIGCQKVSAGCDHCYAETLSNRYGWVQWGPHGERRRTSAANWRKPIQWDKAAKASGRRPRVFCASLADVFDNQAHQEWRDELFEMIAATPNLDWLLLSKRPENIDGMLPLSWRASAGPNWGNVWLGTTCEDQAAYDRRWPILSKIPAAVHFISYEPAIGPLRINPGVFQPDWLICGGESGPGARMMDPNWAAAIKHDCQRAGIHFFMKQMTGKKPIPDHLMLREFPRAA
jgi:protein gp37